MKERKLDGRFIDRSQLRPLEAAVFPRNWAVRVDKPQGLVAHANGLVGFEAANVLIRVRDTRNEFPLHIAPLSLLFTNGGQETYEVDGQRFVLDDNSYLIHNAGQYVSSSIDSPTPVEGFTIGFWPGFAEEVLRSLVTPADHLLDNPQTVWRQPVRFFDQLYPQDQTLSPFLMRFRCALETNQSSRGWLEEQYHLLLTVMLRVHRNIGRDIERLPAARASTRAELYRRLHRARDFMEANLDQPLTIPQIAQSAWFSPHHFLRQFKLAFTETPHQYLTRRRLERTQHLLRTTDMPITDICFQVGFESLGSFSWLFKQKIGVSPEQFRTEQKRVRTLLIKTDIKNAETATISPA